MDKRRSDFLGISLALSALTLAAPVGAIAMAPPPQGGVLLVIGPEADRIVKNAGGRRIGPMSAPWGVLARGDDGFTDRVLAAGAWRVTGATWMAALCEKDSSWPDFLN